MLRMTEISVKLKVFSKNSGYDVSVYENAHDFYDAPDKSVPNLVLLDIMLPDEGGLAIVEKLRKILLRRRFRLFW